MKSIAALLLAAIVGSGHLTFEIAAQGMKFDLKQEGDQISGKIVCSHEGETRTATINLKRQP